MSADKHPESVPELFDALRALREENPKALRSTVHLYPPAVYAPQHAEASSSKLPVRRITSWKMTEHMYFSSRDQFPTLARGLFSAEQEDGEDRIVARGYDKFFNIDEVPWTNWASMKEHTEAPYHLTLKSNGCLILISALSPTHLVVASKHSLGTTTETQLAKSEDADSTMEDGVAKLTVDDKQDKGKGKAEDEIDEHLEAKQHAEVGRMWVKRTLAKSGKTEKDLAKKLWDEGLSAVLELCDDSFEEHVIATPAHWTGLHLHGLNTNTPHFNTLPPDQVKSFADDFGFIPTKYVTFDTIEEVQKFSDEVAQSGSWEGDMIEGFVVRATVKASDPTHQESKPPYRAGSPFFFKVKFEEPYLLYRTWREVTRLMLPLLKDITSEEAVKIRKRVKSKTKRSEVAIYVNWIERMIYREPTLFDHFDKGVVRVRDRFLRWTEGEGKNEWLEALAGKPVASNESGGAADSRSAKKEAREGLKKKFVIVPMAIPGCGKTLIGNSLGQLFGFAHTQSDDVTAKKTAPTFLKNIASLLEKHDVVFADRNNHLDKHYDELTEMPFNMKLGTGKTLKNYDVRFIGVQWGVGDLPYHRVLRVCSDRVVGRGDNHQTLRPDLTIEAEHEAIVGQFLRNFQEPDADDYERIIKVGVLDEPSVALQKVVTGLVDILDVEKPDEAALEVALQKAQEYKTTTPYHAPARISKTVRYFGLAPEINLFKVVSDILSASPNESAQKFLQSLQENTRLTFKPHVTLSHENNVKSERELNGPDAPAGPHERCWDQCKFLAEEGSSAMYTYHITHLVWDDRVMSLIIDELRPVDKEVVQLEVPVDYAKYLHITVGTRSEEIPAFESRGIVSVAREGIASGSSVGEADEVVEGGGKIRWLTVQEPLGGQGRVRGMW